MKRSSIWIALLGVACAAQPDKTDDGDSDTGGKTSGSSGMASGGSSGGKGGSGGAATTTSGSPSGGAGSAGMHTVSGSAGKNDGGAESAGGEGDGAGVSGGGTGGASSAGSGGSGGSGRIDQKEITARYQAIETGVAAPVQHIYGQVRAVNTGGGNAYLKDTKIRYYFTNELAPTVPQFEIQLKQLQAPNLTMDVQCVATLVKMPTPTATADTYIELTFPNDAQVLDSGKTLLVQFRIFDPAPTQPKFVQSNDYSFNAQTVDTDKITLYYKANIIWGNEPE